MTTSHHLKRTPNMLDGVARPAVIRRTGALVLGLGLALTGCSTAGDDDAATPAPSVAESTSPQAQEAAGPSSAKPSPSPTPEASPSPSPSAAASGPTAPGFAFGEVPPVPLLTLPDLSLLEGAANAFATSVQNSFSGYPGLTVTSLTCDASGAAEVGRPTLITPGSTLTTTTEVGSVGIAGGMLNVYGDGSGSFESPAATVWNYGDGSGSYEDAETTAWLYGDGSGSWESSELTHWNYGDGTASYDDGAITIWNYGDGSGSYESAGLSIWNFGDGRATVNGVETTADPLPPVPPVGVFPSLNALLPQATCGTRITLDSGVLFDIDQATIRPDATTVLDSVAAVMIDHGVPMAVIEGHTDSVSSDEHNLTLSEQRADAVVAALEQRGVPTSLEGVGYGETRLIAPETVNGVDDPAGRQANRRVEILIPSF